MRTKLGHHVSWALLATCGLALGLFGGRALNSPSSASAYSFEWPGQAYPRDWWGRYAYRDLYFQWGPWGSNNTYVTYVESYSAIGSPLTGWTFNYWLTTLDGVIFKNNTSTFLLTYATSPQIPFTYFNSFEAGDFWVGFQLCEYSLSCLPIAYSQHGQVIEGKVGANSEFGSQQRTSFPQIIY